MNWPFQRKTSAMGKLPKMIKRKLQDLTVCCTYQCNFMQHKGAHGSREFRRQYQVEGELGRGGFGIVYKAQRISDGLQVAVKFVEHRHVREWTMTSNQLIPSEVCHLETCRDIPGVIRLIDWFANSKGFLMVMERPEPCMDVFDLVAMYGRLDETTARIIFTQVVDTVTTMHNRYGLVHRDIKDENLIINVDSGDVKLVDFGATSIFEKAKKQEFQGTRSYCPPEWFKQLQYLPLEATAWSLGVLLYILVTGRLPFRNEVQICVGRPSFPAFLSKECESLIKRCLCVSPKGRATLTEIREHSWLAVPLDRSRHSFLRTLERAMGKKYLADERSPRHVVEEGSKVEEEEAQINDVILLAEADDATSPLPLVLQCHPSSSCVSTCSSAFRLDALGDGARSMATTTSSGIASSAGLPSSVSSINNSRARRLRTASKYENWSCASTADDFESVASLATTNNIYYSVQDIFDSGSLGDDELENSGEFKRREATEEDEEDFNTSSLQENVPVVGDQSKEMDGMKKSVSSHLFGGSITRRRRSLASLQQEKELGTVKEISERPHAMTASVISTGSTTDEPTLCEDNASFLPKDKVKEKNKAQTSLTVSTSSSSKGRCSIPNALERKNSPTDSRVVASPVLSRHRPLLISKAVEHPGPPHLAVFQVPGSIKV